MPYKHIKFKIPKNLDRRRKLTDDDRQNIKNMYFEDHLLIREIARYYEKLCSRRLIQFVLFPERAELQAKHHKENAKDGRYYNKDKWREQMKRHRQYKQVLYLKNKLILWKIINC